MRTKAQGLSLSVIIIAVIGLLVLVILAVIFSGRIISFREGTEDCASKSGVCAQAPDYKCDRDYASLPGTECVKQDGSKQAVACCIPTIR